MKVDTFQKVHIAPCGANCMICMGYMKSENSCPGCGGIISVHRGFCSECGKIYYNHNGTKRKPIK